ncbi:hypothetical protein [Acidithiobacillus caldus]|uniref:Uncharacterized protein n=1 Tax=Acidithiobacillus caldus TaxID=33059 RepID=A0A1E7YN03_9PROT|nr:hypothetical protein [Acidithiobacillus caldus]OFC35858.1 hypothetical protein BAE27_07010 [Acidithiobacillus caldus]OFC39144.1 hypothetical protein BAE29_07865 [Acidithiobacillus caldus]
MSFNTKLFLFWLAGVVIGPVVRAALPVAGLWIYAVWVGGPIVFWAIRAFFTMDLGTSNYSHWDIQKAREEGRQQGYNNGYHNGRNS